MKNHRFTHEIFTNAFLTEKQPSCKDTTRNRTFCRDLIANFYTSGEIHIIVNNKLVFQAVFNPQKLGGKCPEKNKKKHTYITISSAM